LCSIHFTRDCFERDLLRMMELGVDGTFKRRLKPDATPNVQTRKNSIHCLWFLCCCTQTLHRTPFGTSSYFTHVDVCFGLLITALLCKYAQLRKAWIHYCRRWNFDPTSGHRLCSTHFTRDCFERDPLRMMELGVDGTWWSTICDLMLDRNSIVDSNGSRLCSAGRPLGTRKNSVH
jgi:hypothetical protein